MKKGYMLYEIIVVVLAIMVVMIIYTKISGGGPLIQRVDKNAATDMQPEQVIAQPVMEQPVIEQSVAEQGTNEQDAGQETDAQMTEPEQLDDSATGDEAVHTDLSYLENEYISLLAYISTDDLSLPAAVMPPDVSYPQAVQGMVLNAQGADPAVGYLPAHIYTDAERGLCESLAQDSQMQMTFQGADVENIDNLALVIFLPELAGNISYNDLNITVKDINPSDAEQQDYYTSYRGGILTVTKDQLYAAIGCGK